MDHVEQRLDDLTALEYDIDSRTELVLDVILGTAPLPEDGCDVFELGAQDLLRYEHALGTDVKKEGPVLGEFWVARIDDAGYETFIGVTGPLVAEPDGAVGV